MNKTKPILLKNFIKEKKINSINPGKLVHIKINKSVRNNNLLIPLKSFIVGMCIGFDKLTFKNTNIPWFISTPPHKPLYLVYVMFSVNNNFHTVAFVFLKSNHKKPKYFLTKILTKDGWNGIESMLSQYPNLKDELINLPTILYN